MAAVLDGKAERGIDLRPDIIVVDRKSGERGCNVEQRKAMRSGAQIVADRKRLGAEPVEDFELQIECALAGVRDLGLGLAEFAGGEADLARERLAMDEGGVERRRHQLVAVLRRHLDEIAEHVIVPDF